MSVRVALCGTGNVGSYALRGVMDHPELELVGVGVYSVGKVGTDAGVAVGRPPIGLACMPVSGVVDVGADCVILAGKAELDAEPTVALACDLLSRGANVVSTALMSLNHPRSMAERHRKAIETSCERGATSFHGTGINPGFFADLVSVFLSGLSVGVDGVRSTEIYDYEEKTSRATVVDLLRIGRPLGEKEERIKRQTGVADSPMYIIGDAMGVELDAITLDYDLIAAAETFEIAATTVEKGSLAAYRRTFTGTVAGRPRIVFDFVHRAARHVAPHWPPPGDESGLRWTNVVEGSPRVEAVVELGTTQDVALPGPAAVAARAVNAIPGVCSSAPGIKTVLDLPFFGGRFRPPPR